MYRALPRYLCWMAQDRTWLAWFTRATRKWVVPTTWSAFLVSRWPRDCLPNALPPRPSGARTWICCRTRELRHRCAGPSTRSKCSQAPLPCCVSHCLTRGICGDWHVLHDSVGDQELGSNVLLLQLPLSTAKRKSLKADYGPHWRA